MHGKDVTVMTVIIVVTGEKYRSKTVSKKYRKIHRQMEASTIERVTKVVRLLADLNLMRPKSVRVEILSGNKKDSGFLIS